ncbi:tetraacyldisaccharide 4'-kinase [Silvanigrella sp.]|jgi:tetraacyldisaccharide 4'-kinase|uniref:tetraacyldisaccharide 4'-kinase n=1 Tax=Silvanigrella sp. TaxID=2024976 RepID=UPI0037C8134A
MPESIGQKIRNQLDLPFYKKNIIFWIFSPLLIIISILIHFISKKRREISYPNKSILNIKENLNIDYFNIICVGNIIIGGTGKSPVVQKMAQIFLAQGYIVAIASRGIGQNIKNIYVNNLSNTNDINNLSDENREHFEILKKLSKKESIFYVLQNKRRLFSLEFLINEIKTKNTLHNLKCVVILDDGLQHFECPRDINICLWSTDIVQNSPHFCMPIGPFREGFGKKSFQNLLLSFNYRFWSRTSFINIENYKQQMKDCLNKFSLELSNKDIIVTYLNSYFMLDIQDSSIKIGKEVTIQDLNLFFKSQKSIGFIAGIANPNKLFLDLKNTFKLNKLDSIFLDDHGKLTKKAIDLINTSDSIIFTLKDFFRWCQQPVFLNMIKNKNIILCSIEVSFRGLDNDEIDIIKKNNF